MSRDRPAGGPGRPEAAATSAVGARLREAREKRGLSEEAASREAGLPLRYLRMLEEGRFPTVADPAYLTHFLRRYARFLGLDPAATTRSFLEETEPETASRRIGRAAAAPRVPLLGHPGRQTGARNLALSAALLAAAIGGVFAFVRSRQEPETLALVWRPRTAADAARGAIARPPGPSKPMAAPNPPAGNPPGLLEERGSVAAASPPAAVAGLPPSPGEPGRAVAADRRDGAEAGSAPALPPTRSEIPSSEAFGEAVPNLSARDAVSPPAATASIPASVRAGAVEPRPFELRLVATARQVWVWVSVDGGPRRAISLDRGESVAFRAQERCALSLDDAGGVVATLDGKRLPPFGRPGQARRNIVVPSVEFSPQSASGGA